jgi:hypothetical protein
VQNVTIPCCSQELLPFFSVNYFFFDILPPTIVPSSFTSSYHLFLGLPRNLVVPKFIYNTLFGIMFSSIFCTCPNDHSFFHSISCRMRWFLAILRNFFHSSLLYAFSFYFLPSTILPSSLTSSYHVSLSWCCWYQLHV